MIFHRVADPQLWQAGVPIGAGNTTALNVQPFRFCRSISSPLQSGPGNKPGAPPSLPLEMGYLSKKYIGLSIEGRPHLHKGNAQGWDFFLDAPFQS